MLNRPAVPRAVLCLGLASQDTLWRVPTLPTEPVKMRASDVLQVGGGMAATAAVTVARLRGRAAYWGRVGRDAVGEAIVDELAAEGVDTAEVRRFDGCRSTVATVLVDRAGERLVCTFIDPALPDETDWLPLERIAHFDAVLADTRWPLGATAVLAAARRHGIPGVLDADISDAETLVSLAAEASHTVFSAPALRRFAGCDDLAEALRQSCRARPPGAVFGVTDGERGSLWLIGDRVQRIPAPPVRAVDTLGAGDVFHGALALALAEGQGLEPSACFAGAAAALKCKTFGGRRGTPRREQVDALLQEKERWS